MTAFGIEGYQPIKFELSLKLFKDIVAEDSYWKMDSVGRMFMNLTKTDATQGTLWKRLVESNQKIPIWWEMKTTYRQDMDDFQKIIDEEEDIKEKVKSFSSYTSLLPYSSSFFLLLLSSFSFSFFLPLLSLPSLPPSRH